MLNEAKKPFFSRFLCIVADAVIVYHISRTIMLTEKTQMRQSCRRAINIVELICEEKGEML